MPHVVVLAGPFVNQAHEDVQSGDLRYRDSITGQMKFLDYQGLFDKIMEYLFERIPKETQVVIMPSNNEIIHNFPMPQPAMDEKLFGKQS